ncbi:hypothetical protein KGQ20_32945 [Catenulispora sp. NF23]|uniref:hypothetical protein n=1 Tax=Catenulispora pinistramenti TaxID=2705254 RepID=UPI001BAC06EE|nr:hypothetical protein [Catenulispora pinistramenti]MBS2537570.1 hypothetical protein [Catenulispora pinistramenti]
MSLRTRLSVAAIGAVVAVGAVALPANAATATDSPAALTKAKATVTKDIADRLTTLGKLQSALTGYKDVPDAARGTLTQVMSADVSGLTTLKAKVAGETTAAAVKADGQAMVDDYRVYVLVVPQVHLTHALDVENAALARLVKVHDALADRLAKDPAADTAANKALLADLSTAVQAGGSGIDGKDAALLALKPGPDGKALTAAVKDVSGAAKGTRDDIKKAVADAKKVRDALKDTQSAAKS